MKIDNEIKSLFKNFKESDPDLRVREKHVATSGLNPFVRYNSSPRGLMMSSHIAQALTLVNPDKQIVFSGLEREMGKYSITKKMMVDGEVITVLKRYKETILGKEPVEYVIVYRNLETGEIDALEIPNYNTFHPYFGFRYEINKDYIENLFTGEIIPKDTVLAWPPTYDPETGDYGYGKNLNVAFMTLDGVAEDGFIISKSALKKLQFKLFEKRSINVGSDTFPLNLYGDEDNYKPFPELYESINDTGVVMCIRKYDDMLMPALLSKVDVKNFNPIFDKAYYTKGEGGKVIDIKVFKTHKKKLMPKDTDVLLDKYADALLMFYQDVLDTYKRIEKSHSVSEVKYGKHFERLVIEAMNVINSTKPKSKIKKTYRKEEMDLYWADFVIEYLVTPTIGFKLSGYHGNKGVIVRVWDDEDMPVDQDGNRADLIMDPSSIVSRLNVGVMYERYFAATSRKAKKLITDEIKAILNKNEITFEDINSLNDNVIKEIFGKYVLGLVSIIGNKQFQIYKEAFDANRVEDMRSVIAEIVLDEFYLHYTVEDNKEAWEIVLEIENSIFKPPYGPVTYRENGRRYTTKRPVMIAPMYTLLLNKIADSVLSTSSAKVNHFGLPIGVSRLDKYRLPWKNNPVRNLGETESRLIASYGGREMLAELKDRGSSIETHTMVYRSILEADKPTNIDEAVDRTKHPFGTDKALDNLLTLFDSSGLDIKFVEDKRRFIEPKESIAEKVDIDEVEEEDIKVDLKDED